jgi:hypothetical protein
MKRIIFTLLIAFSVSTSKAQLVLNKAFTPVNGRYYFELANNSSTAQNLGCYTLISYYKTAVNRGFYVINLPRVDLPAKGFLTIGNTPSAEVDGSRSNVNLSFATLFSEGLLQRQVIDQRNNSFYNSTSQYNAANLFNQLTDAAEFDDPMVLLFNGSTLIDASFTIDGNRNLSPFLRLLPNLSFTNNCGNLVTVRFAALQSMFRSIFNRPNAQDHYGYFKEFEIQRNNAMVQIAWQTTREQNNRGFEIERRIGSEPWSTVAYIATLAPEGNSSETLNYLYGDNTLLNGNVQYRLKQVDLNGQTAYSTIRSLNDFAPTGKMILYPNPTTDGRVNIAFGNINSLRDIQVVDLNGQIVQQWVSVNNTNQQVNNLKRGNYFIRVIDRQTAMVFTEKLVVQ